jgi:hypothetical protein
MKNFLTTLITFLFPLHLVIASITFVPHTNAFNPSITEGKIGTLIITSTYTTGFTLSIKSSDPNGDTELDFDSIQGAQVLFSIDCKAISNQGSNTFLDTNSGGIYEKVTHLDTNSICLETNAYNHHPTNLSIDINLNIENDSGMLYDPQGYQDETIKLILTNKV